MRGAADMFKAIRTAGPRWSPRRSIHRNGIRLQSGRGWRPTSQHHHRLNLLTLRWHQPRSTRSPWTCRRWHSKGFLLSDVSNFAGPHGRRTICCPQLPAAMPTRPQGSAEAGGPQGVARGPGRRRSPALYDVGFGGGEAHRQKSTPCGTDVTDRCAVLISRVREHPHMSARCSCSGTRGEPGTWVCAGSIYQAMLPVPAR